MATVNQNSFAGGMNYLTVMTKLAAGEYPIAQNIRVRYGGAEPIKRPKDFTGKFVPGNVQGIYGANEKLLVLISGNAYYMDCNTNVVRQSSGFAMSADVQDIYGELVPAAGVQYRRVPVTPGQANTDVNLSNPVTGTPAAGIFFDGVTRPTLILSNGSARPAGDYTSWTPDIPEYVPQGLIPLYVNGILYLGMYDDEGSPSKLLNILARSVENEPLNFMIIVDGNGNKLNSESEGGARIQAVPFNYGEITSLARISSSDGTFYAGTAKSSVLIQPDFSALIYGEPQFNLAPIFDTGAVNSFSIVGLLGDTALIDQNGLVSFNSVQQLKWQSNNAPFSKDVYKLFQNIRQTRTAAVSFDNYALFSITTVFGPAVLVYDTLIGKYVSLDIHPEIAQICQFAIIKTNNIYRLFARTIQNQIVELFASDSFATARIYIGDHADPNPTNVQRVDSVAAVFMGSGDDGTAECRIYVDKVEMGVRTAKLNYHNFNIPQPYPIPYQPQRRDTDPTTFNFNGTPAGWKIGAMLTWSTGAQLTHVQIQASDFAGNMSLLKQSEIAETSYTGGTQRLCIMSRWTSVPGGQHNVEFVKEIRTFEYDYLLSTGNLNDDGSSYGTLLGITNNILTPLNPEFTPKLKFYSAVGTLDLDVNHGQPFIDSLRQPHNSRYFTVDCLGVLCHFINPGYNTAGANLDDSRNPVGPSLEPDGNTTGSRQSRFFEGRSLAARLNLHFSNLPLYTGVSEAIEYKLLRWDNLHNINVHFSYAPAYERIVNTDGLFVNIPGDYYIIADVGIYQINFTVYKFGVAVPQDAFVAQI